MLRNPVQEDNGHRAALLETAGRPETLFFLTVKLGGNFRPPGGRHYSGGNGPGVTAASGGKINQCLIGGKGEGYRESHQQTGGSVDTRTTRTPATPTASPHMKSGRFQEPTQLVHIRNTFCESKVSPVTWGEEKDVAIQASLHRQGRSRTTLVPYGQSRIHPQSTYLGSPLPRIFLFRGPKRGLRPSGRGGTEASFTRFSHSAKGKPVRESS